MRGPDQRLARAKYRREAWRYDRRISAIFERYRRRAVEALELSAGDSVIDVACGTGANFALLQECVGAEGRVVGVDLSPEMLDIAARRVISADWSNVELIESCVEDASLSGPFDGALFSLTHDVLQSPAALANVIGQLKPGARVASFGAKSAPRWRWPVNFVVQRLSLRYITTFAGLHEPWANLGRVVPGLEVKPVALGGGYLAWGTLPTRS